MLTVKLIQPDYREQIREAIEVWTDPAGAPAGEYNKFTTVHALQPNGQVVSFSGYGTVFVMNEGGQTIAKYLLGYGHPVETVEEQPKKAA